MIEGWRQNLGRFGRGLFSAASVRHWTFFGWLVFTVVLAVAAWQRGVLPAIAVADPDTWGYFIPALKLLSGGGFVQEGGRDWLYSAFIAGSLQITGSMAGLVRIQQVLGLLSGLLMILALRSWAAFLPRTAAREAGVAIVGGLAVCLYLWRPYTSLAEMQVRPEAIWSFFIFAQILVLLEYGRERWVRGRLWPALGFAVATCVLAYVNLLLRPSWGLAVPLAMVPILLGVWGPRAGMLLRVLTPVVAVVVTVLVLWLPLKFFFTRDLRSENRLPMALFTIHAKWILQHFEEEARTLPPGSSEREFPDRILAVFAKEFQHMDEKEGVYDELGFDADYLQYRSPLFGLLQKELGLTDAQLNAFLRQSYVAAWRSQPMGMGGKVWTQYQYFLLPDYDIFYKRSMDFQKRFQLALPELPENPAGLSDSVGKIYAGFRGEVAAAAQRELVVHPHLILQRVARVFADGAPYLVVVFLILLAVCFRLRESLDVRLAGLFALLLYGLVAAHAMTIAIIHALDVNRYRLSYAGPLLLALAVMAIFCVTVIPRLMDRRKSAN